MFVLRSSVQSEAPAGEMWKVCTFVWTSSSISPCSAPLARVTDVQIIMREAEAHLRVCANSINFTKTIKTVPSEAGSSQDTTNPTGSRG